MSDIATSIPTGDIITEKTTDEPSFIDTVPESYREKPYMKGIDSMDKFVEQFDNAQSLIGKKTIGVPTEESPIEEWNQFFNKMGRPEAPDKYELDLVDMPDEFKRTDDQLALMKNVFHEAGLTAKQANQILKKTDEAVLKYHEDNKDEISKQLDSRNKEFTESMNKYFGEEKETAIAVTETMLKEYVPKGMEDMVKGIDDRSMLVLSTVLHNIHKAGKTEDKISKNVVITPEVTPESMREEAKKLMMTKEFRDAFHPNHDATKKKVQEMYQKIANPSGA